MAMLLRLLPRHWDGKRLLRFLAGLVLLALTFGGPAAAPAAAASPAASGTASAALSAVSGTASAATSAGSGTASAVRAGTAENSVATMAGARAGAAEKSAAKSADGTATSANTATVERPIECQHDASGVRRLIPTRPAGPVGVASGAHGSRSPPRA